MQNRNHIPTNDFLKGQVKKAFQNFSQSFTAIKITANIIKRYAEALIMISRVYKTKVNKEIIADGFVCSGQHCMPSRDCFFQNNDASALHRYFRRPIDANAVTNISLR